MKKTLLLLVLSLLVSCSPSSSEDGSSSIEDPSSNESVTTETGTSIDESTIETPPVLDVFISEIYGSEKNLFSRALEIGNVGDSINLSGYKLKIYSGKNLQKEILLDGVTLETNSAYVIANKDNDDYNYHSKADLVLEDNYLSGSNYIEFVNDKDVVFDSVGSIYRLKYAVYQSYLRLPSAFKSSATFNQLDFINLRVDENYSYLGNLDSPYQNPQEFLEGPRITEEMYALPFESGSAPGGGFAPVTVRSYGDGDTTIFNYGNSYTNVESNESTRYMYINTPEISHAGEEGKEWISAEPWGYAAKTFNNDKLKNAKSIMVQSVRGGSFRESYGRLLGFVWYAEKENPELSDYKLLNYELILQGYANLGAEDDLKLLYTENAYYKSYFEFAFLWAQKSGIKIHGEKDPDYEY